MIDHDVLIQKHEQKPVAGEQDPSCNRVSHLLKTPTGRERNFLQVQQLITCRKELK